jgi:hypothetical protein
MTLALGSSDTDAVVRDVLERLDMYDNKTFRLPDNFSELVSDMLPRSYEEEQCLRETTLLATSDRFRAQQCQLQASLQRLLTDPRGLASLLPLEAASESPATIKEWSGELRQTFRANAQAVVNRIINWLLAPDGRSPHEYVLLSELMVEGAALLDQATRLFGADITVGQQAKKYRALSQDMIDTLLRMADVVEDGDLEVRVSNAKPRDDGAKHVDGLLASTLHSAAKQQRQLSSQQKADGQTTLGWTLLMRSVHVISILPGIVMGIYYLVEALGSYYADISQRPSELLAAAGSTGQLLPQLLGNQELRQLVYEAGRPVPLLIQWFIPHLTVSADTFAALRNTREPLAVGVGELQPVVPLWQQWNNTLSARVLPAGDDFYGIEYTTVAQICLAIFFISQTVAAYDLYLSLDKFSRQQQQLHLLTDDDDDEPKTMAEEKGDVLGRSTIQYTSPGKSGADRPQTRRSSRR